MDLVCDSNWVKDFVVHKIIDKMWEVSEATPSFLEKLPYDNLSLEQHFGFKTSRLSFTTCLVALGRGHSP